jgi:hypothetical protein
MGDSVAVDCTHLESATRWAGKVVGIATCTFPHPREWGLGGILVPLDGITVRNLTREIASAYLVEPSCIANWAKRIGDLPAQHRAQIQQQGAHAKRLDAPLQEHGCRGPGRKKRHLLNGRSSGSLWSCAIGELGIRSGEAIGLMLDDSRTHPHTYKSPIFFSATARAVRITSSCERPCSTQRRGH